MNEYLWHAYNKASVKAYDTIAALKAKRLKLIMQGELNSKVITVVENLLNESRALADPTSWEYEIGTYIKASARYREAQADIALIEAVIESKTKMFNHLLKNVFYDEIYGPESDSSAASII